MSKTVFVLHAGFGEGPDEVWAFTSQAAAEDFLREWAKIYFPYGSVDHVPADDDLVEAFAKTGGRIGLAVCGVDGGGGVWLEPFERAPETA